MSLAAGSDRRSGQPGSYQRIRALPQVKPPPMASIITRSPCLMRPSRHGDVEGQRDRGRRGVAVPVDGDHHLLGRDAELVGAGVDDAPVGLVRHEPVEILGASCRSPRRRRGPRPSPCRPRSGRPPGPPSAGCRWSWSSPGRRRRRACRDGGRPSADGRSARRDRRRCPRPPAPRARSAPAPSPNSTQVVRSFQSRMREKVSAPITSARLCDPEVRNLSAVATRVDEAGADRLEVEGGAVVDAEPVLDLRRGRREGVVRRRGRADDRGRCRRPRGPHRRARPRPP